MKVKLTFKKGWGKYKKLIHIWTYEHEMYSVIDKYKEDGWELMNIYKTF